MTLYAYRFTGDDAVALKNVKVKNIGDEDCCRVKFGLFLHTKNILSRLDSSFTKDSFTLYDAMHMQRDGVSGDVTLSYNEIGIEPLVLVEALDRFKRGAEPYRITG